jgi:hypothetical protein
MNLLLRLALAATLLHLAPAYAQAPKKAPPELQKEFDVFIAKFRAALKANDSAAVAGMTKLPLETVDSARDAAQFRAKTYKQHFTAKTRACLQRSKAVYDRPPDNSEYYAIFCDESIFMFAKTPDGFRFTDIGTND